MNFRLWQLKRQCKSSDVTTRIEAARGLTNYPTSDAIAAIAAALSIEKDKNAIHELGDTLARIGTDDALSVLMEALDHKDFRIVKTAVEALGRTTCKKAIRPLVLLLRREDADLSLPALQHIDSSWRTTAEGRGVVGELIEALASGQQGAARALGRIGDTAAFDQLIAAIRAERNPKECILALGHLPDARVLPALLEIARSSNELEVVTAALHHHSRTRTPDTETIEQLVAAAQDAHAGVARLARGVLTTLDLTPPVASGMTLTLLEFLASDNAVTRKWASRALIEKCDLRGSQFLPALLANLEHRDIQVRLEVIRAIWQLNEPQAFAALAKTVLHDADSKVKTAAAECMVKIGTPRESFDLLLVAVTKELNPTVRNDLHYYLGQAYKAWYRSEAGAAAATAALIAIAHDSPDLDLRSRTLGILDAVTPDWRVKSNQKEFGKKCPNCQPAEYETTYRGSGKCSSCEGSGIVAGPTLTDIMSGRTGSCNRCKGIGICQTCEGRGMLF